MKTIIFFKLLVFVNVIALLSSCEPHDCPDPVDPTTTTKYVAILDGADFMDADVSNFTPTTNYGSYYSTAACAWTNGGTPFLERGYIKFNYADIPAGATVTK